ncbi:MAG: uracil phosphoribosyltransferase [Fulvivirga sp.]|nr:uracil phosphoribosyltransferase [Fulvivirga sp.]
MIHILSQKQSIANHFLFEMRDKDIQNDRARFRQNLKRMGNFMAFEISKTLKYKEAEVATPLGNAKTQLLANQPLIICVLRAALPLYNGFMEVFDQADGGFIGAYREESEEINIQLEYYASPSVEDRVVIVVDPMLATGGSMVKSIDQLLKYGQPDHIHIASVVAAPEGINYISQKIKNDYTLWAFAVDEKLDDRAYIVPGLGDAGDLSFGEKI